MRHIPRFGNPRVYNRLADLMKREPGTDATVLCGAVDTLSSAFDRLWPLLERRGLLVCEERGINRLEGRLIASNGSSATFILLKASIVPPRPLRRAGCQPGSLSPEQHIDAEFLAALDLQRKKARLCLG